MSTNVKKGTAPTSSWNMGGLVSMLPSIRNIKPYKLIAETLDDCQLEMKRPGKMWDELETLQIEERDPYVPALYSCMT